MDAITKTLADALRECVAALDEEHGSRGFEAECPECQANKAARKALAEYDRLAAEVPEVRQPPSRALTQTEIEGMFCNRIDIPASAFTDDPEKFELGQWYRRGWQAAQDYFGITGSTKT